MLRRAGDQRILQQDMADLNVHVGHDHRPS
jgi:hypothetical protein